MKAKRYDVHGEQLTIKEIADRCNITTQALYFRAKKCGGGIEEAIMHYMSEPRETAPATTPEDFTRMAAEILGCDANAEQPEGVRCTECNKQRSELQAYNALIGAMDAMTGVDMDDPRIANQLRDLCMQVRSMRSRMFETLVDWDAIAKGEEA